MISHAAKERWFSLPQGLLLCELTLFADALSILTSELHIHFDWGFDIYKNWFKNLQMNIWMGKWLVLPVLACYFDREHCHEPLDLGVVQYFLLIYSVFDVQSIMVLNSSPLEIWNIEHCGATQLVTATLWPFICLVWKLHQGARGGKIPGIFKKTTLNAICLVIINSIWIYKNVECQCRHAKVFNHPRSWQSVQHILRNPANVVLIKIHCWIPPNWCDRASANHLCFLVCAFSYETCGEFELSSSLQHNYSLWQTCLNLQLLSPKAMMRDVLMHLPGLGRDGSNVHNMLTNLFSSHQLMSFLAGVSVRCELLSAWVVTLVVMCAPDLGGSTSRMPSWRAGSQTHVWRLGFNVWLEFVSWSLSLNQRNRN